MCIRMSRPGGVIAPPRPPPSRILTDQLTLFQARGGQVMPTKLQFVPPPSGFSNLPPVLWLTHLRCSDSTSLRREMRNFRLLFSVVTEKPVYAANNRECYWMECWKIIGKYTKNFLRLTHFSWSFEKWKLRNWINSSVFDFECMRQKGTLLSLSQILWKWPTVINLKRSYFVKNWLWRTFFIFLAIFLISLSRLTQTPATI